MMGTYERDHPKSATLKKKMQKANLARRTSALLNSLNESEPLRVIIEESQQKEGALQQNKSHSERGARPDTPEFTLVESDHFDGELSENDNDNNQDQEQDQIRARMEAQIQSFDDDN